MATESAHRLLVRLSWGRDLGRERASWAAWIARL